MRRLLQAQRSVFSQTLPLSFQISKDPIFVPGVWGPYFSAMVPGFWLNEGGQSVTGKLVSWSVMFLHPWPVHLSHYPYTEYLEGLQDPKSELTFVTYGAYEARACQRNKCQSGWWLLTCLLICLSPNNPFIMAAKVILYFVKRTVVLPSPDPSMVPYIPGDIVQTVFCVHHSLVVFPLQSHTHTCHQG